MSNTGDTPYAFQPGELTPPAPPAPSAGGAALAAGAALLGSAAIGLLGGLIWNQVAPRAVYVVVSRGAADAVNPETSAFITGDLWFCLIGVIGGLIIGVASYRLAIRRYGPLPMLAVLAGSVVAGLAARWVGQNLGLAQFNSRLLNSHLGTLLHAPPQLGAEGGTLWPAIAFWPLAACVVPAALVLIAVLRDRPSGGRRRQLPYQ
jgi:hypothetical protein